MKQELYEKFLKLRADLTEDLRVLCDKHLDAFDEFVLNKETHYDGSDITYKEDYMMLFMCELIGFTKSAEKILAIGIHSPADLEKEGLKPGEVMESIAKEKMMKDNITKLSELLGLGKNGIKFGGVL